MSIANDIVENKVINSNMNIYLKNERIELNTEKQELQDLEMKAVLCETYKEKYCCYK